MDGVEKCFSGGEIIRLFRDDPESGFRAGAQGVVWGIYHGFEELEATFFDSSGKSGGLWVAPSDVERVGPGEVLSDVKSFLKTLMNFESQCAKEPSKEKAG